MTIDEIRALKAEAEARIQEAVDAAVSELSSKTGLAVGGLTVDLIDITTIFDSSRRTVAGRASIELERI